MELTSAFAPITKTTEQDDGSLLVYGKASDGSLDLDDQRCDPAWLDQAMPAWFGADTGTGTRVGGNIRAQHRSDSAVGKAIEHEIAPDGHYITARIVDKDAIAKTKAGVFTGFSIGIRSPKIVKSDLARNGIISGGSIVEVSLVDRPANSNCMLTLCKSAKPGMQLKAADFDSARMLVRVEEFVEKSADDADAPDMTVTLADRLSPEQVAKLNAATVEKAVEPSAPVVKADGPEFDKDAAKTLVAAILAKAAGDDMPPPYDAEQGDIANAQAAIGIISRLIISEASEMCDNPAEDCDIELLMQAVSALRCFQHREQQQAMGADVVDKPVLIALAATPDVEKAKYDAAELDQMLKDGKAFKNPDGNPSYPIGDKDDLSSAIKAVGRGSGDHDAIRAYIRKRAAALGASNMIPDNWTSSGSNDSSKSVESEKEKPVAVLEKTYTLDEARLELGLTPDGDVVVKAVGTAVEKAGDDVETKTVEPVIEKATAVQEADPDALVKAFTAALEKADNPLRKSFEAIVEAATETTAKSVSDLTERLVKVESMATPGGPALKRTGSEEKTALKSDLLRQAEHWRVKSENVQDPDLQKGWAFNAAECKAKADALGV